jgi:hypothetical protein
MHRNKTNDASDGHETPETVAQVWHMALAGLLARIGATAV